MNFQLFVVFAFLLFVCVYTMPLAPFPFTKEFVSPFGYTIRLESELPVVLTTKLDGTIDAVSPGIVRVFHNGEFRYNCEGGAYGFGKNIKVTSNGDTTMCFGEGPFDHFDTKMDEFIGRTIMDFLGMDWSKCLTLFYKGLMIAANGGSVTVGVKGKDEPITFTSSEDMAIIVATTDAYAICNDDGIKHSLKELIWTGNTNAEWKPFHKWILDNIEN